MAAKKNITIDQGTDYSQSFYVGLNGSNTIVINDAVHSNPLNLTGYTGESHMRKNYSSSTKTTLTVTFTARANGHIKLSLNRLTSANTTDGRYVYDIELTKTSSNNRIRLCEGIATVTPEVTK